MIAYGAIQVLRNICVCKVYTRTSSPLTFDYSCIFVTIVSQWILKKDTSLGLSSLFK